MAIMVGSMAVGQQAWSWSGSRELTSLSTTSRKQRELTRNEWTFENSNPTSKVKPPPTRPHPQILPKQLHQLRTKHSTKPPQSSGSNLSETESS